MADFVEYVNGDTAGTWGAPARADGHAKPFERPPHRARQEHLIKRCVREKVQRLGSRDFGPKIRAWC